MNRQPKLLPLAVALLLAGSALPALAEDAPAAPAFTGHVDLVSRYVLRGATSTYGNGAALGNKGADAPESNHPALQWGADYTDPSGFYAGYWASMVNYSYKQLGDSYSNRSITTWQSDRSVENDFYAGYVGTLDDFSYTVGFTGYVYYNGSNADALETKLGVGYGKFTGYAQTLLKDVVWGNKGDTYFTLNFADKWVHDLAFTASLGWYYYKKEGKYLGTTDTFTGAKCGAGEAFNVNGCYAGDTPTRHGFRHMIFGLSQPIGDTGVTWGTQLILPGVNRFGTTQKPRIVGSLSYAF
ncbi:TorF family putative porin [Derxia lacustris]|uniref:TorF family putative porin n=1 Tax=Derxia lacustris TaxID=764842 RepID=UPI000A1735A0|nr:TorF family putative porin [Derxia lacustris]